MAERPDYDRMTSLTGLFFSQAARLGEKPFLWAKRDGTYAPTTWREAAETANRLARGLRAMGVKDGDRVVLCAENRPEWLIADIAIMAAGAITVPAYVTNTANDHAHIIEDSGAVAAIVGNDRIARHLLPAALNTARMQFVAGIDRLKVDQQGNFPVVQWDALIGKGEATADFVADRVAATRRNDLSCLVYTSGTGGAPKGVMLTHGSIICNCMGAHDILEELGLGDEVFLSFLPLSHSYEHTAGQFFPVSIGAQIYYAEGADTLATNMLEARPTIMTAVPRLYETMRTRILRGLENQPARNRALFHKAVRLGTKRYENPKSLGFGERLVDKTLDLLVRRKVAARFGGRLKGLVSGGAPLNREVGVFFTALGLRLMQGYGQTEASPVISCNPPFDIKIHTVGKALSGVEIAFAEDGEILVRGELVMQGYWNNPDATAAAIRDGWLHTGDIGVIDGDGYIEITDRKKDIIVNSGGDNVSPQRVEGFLTLQPEIGQAMVYGDKRPYLVALIVPDEAIAKAWAETHGKSADLGALSTDPDFVKLISAAVERVNLGLSQIERIRRFLIADEAFTIDNARLTPSLKIRRTEIKKAYGDALEALY